MLDYYGNIKDCVSFVYRDVVLAFKIIQTSVLPIKKHESAIILLTNSGFKFVLNFISVESSFTS